MEVVGKGNYSKGSVWVASRVPDGSVCAHANQARTRTFPRDRPDIVRYSKDVVLFASRIGAYSGSDANFSFSDVYDPVTFLGARACEARVYSFFAAVAAPEERIETYLDYAQGRNLTNRMPLFVKVKAKLSVNATMWHMRNHYEGTWFDPRNDVGAQAWRLPNRLAEGLTWTHGGSEYVNERPIGTQIAAWNFVGVQRPGQRFSVLWFGPDDSTFSIHAPFYGATNRVPSAWDDANCTGRSACREAFGLPGTRTKFSLLSQHWIQNMIANHAYSRYSEVAPILQGRIAEMEAGLFRSVQDMDAQLNSLSDPRKAAEAASNFSYEQAERLHQAAHDLFGELFVRFVDGFHLRPDPANEQCGCVAEYPHWSDEWKARIAAEDAGRDHYKVPAGLAARPEVIPKTSLRALGGRGSCDRRAEATTIVARTRAKGEE